MTRDPETLSAAPADAAPAMGRRAALTRAALAAGAAAVAGSLFAPSPALAVEPALTFSQIPGTGDIKVLNYALALEALEADLYAQALMRLTTGGTNALGKKIVGLNLGNSPDVQLVAEFGKVEREHRDFINGALGGQSLLAAAPFNAARFDFNIQNLSRRQVVELVYTAEKTGVSAYLGAIPLFATRNYLRVAGAIQGTEARHTAVFAYLLNKQYSAGLNVAPLANQNGGRDAPLSPNAVLAAVSPFIVLGNPA